MRRSIALRMGVRPQDDQRDAVDALCQELRKQLGPFGYQWLCACAIYPGLRFPLSTGLGAALAQALGRPAPDEDECLAVFRLPWFRKGWMPDELRLRLLADLVPEARKAARETIEQILYSALVEPADAAPGRPLVLRQPPKRWSEMLRAGLEVAPPEAREHDLIFARWMSGRIVQPLALALDRRLTRLLGRGARGWLDRRTLAGGLIVVALALLVWWQADVRLQPAFEQTREEQRRIEIFQECPECPEMVVIPTGSFRMGSPTGEADRRGGEYPLHQVSVARFAIGRHEVTFAEYDQFCRETKCKMPGDEGRGRGRRPVINVAWDDAQAYVRWLSQKTGATYRLPSEAEWEYAARAGTVTPYWWGASTSTRVANMHGSRGWTTEVGSYPPNPWGLHDTSGNVWELVEDCWHASYADAPADGRAWTQPGCTHRVARGGSWYFPEDFLSASRDRVRPRTGSANWYLGFRVSRTLSP